MLIDLKNLKLQVKKSEHFSLQEYLENELLSDVEGRFLKPCKVELTVERTGRLYIANGNVETELKLLCSRCLKEINYLVKLDLNFTLAESTYEHEFSAEENDIIFFSDTQVDITPVVQETILVNLPIRILCHEDCQGLCAECGADKNITHCSCQKGNIDPRWEKLKDLL